MSLTVLELRDFLNELIEEIPSCKDKEVKMERWETDFYGDQVTVYDSVSDVAYLTDKEILTIEGEE